MLWAKEKVHDLVPACSSFSISSVTIFYGAVTALREVEFSLPTRRTLALLVSERVGAKVATAINDSASPGSS